MCAIVVPPSFFYKQSHEVKEDVIKSVEILVEKGETNGALCIAFLRFDPHPDEINECKELCF